MLADPEPWEDSEEQFESSLISSEQPDCYRSIPLGPSDRMPDVIAEDSVAEEDPQFARLDRREQRAQLDRDLSQQAETWRNTLSSKLDQYRSRRGKERLAGQFTMSLDFERSTHRAVLSATAPAIEPEPPFESEVVEKAAEGVATPVFEDFDVPGPAAPLVTHADVTADIDAALASSDDTAHSSRNDEWIGDPPQDVLLPAAVEQAPPPAPPARKKRERKVIEFPRLVSVDPPPQSSNELAESILDRPRIMDVPEETEQIELPLGGISLDPAHEDVTATQQPIDVPFQVAAVSQRVFAGIADSVLILIATAIFAGIVLNFAGALPYTKLMLIVALVVPALFWTAYHYFFLVHAATTPGMLLARIRLATFEGNGTNRNIRRVRAFAMLISCLSAGLGFVWALVDEDTLCWHDKISRTYLANR